MLMQSQGRVEYFSTICLVFRYCLMYYFYLFLILLVSGHYRLDISFFKKIQDYEDKTLRSSKREARQVTLDHIDPMCSLSLSSIHTSLNALILYLSLIVRIWVHTWLVMLSHVVMHVVQVFSSFVMFSLACVFMRGSLSSVEMWFDRCQDWCCGLSKVGMVETVGFCQVKWLVMLESAQDQILRVDTPGQDVPPCVQYRMDCLLISYATGYVSCSVE
jgi:hypothetical protein